MNCVIIGAAKIENYNKIKSYVNSDDYIIVCDGGLNHLKELNVTPNLIIGDFDSHQKPETSIETIQLPCEKDDTDTFYAVKEAYRRGYKSFTLVGVVGQRFDHTLCNLSILLWLYEENCSAVIIDDYSEMNLIGPETLKNPATISDSYSYFSLMLPCGDVSGVTITNAKYPLNKADIKSSYQFGISNEVIKGNEAFVSVEKGKLLLIKVW